MTFSVFDAVLILLIVAVIMITVFRYLHIPAVIGYILVGVMVGPHALGWISSTANTQKLANLGVVFLMFTVGLEFSLTLLRSMKKQVFVYGGLEVLLSIVITSLIGRYVFGMTLAEVIIVGSIAAMSSTAIVTKQLTDQFELHTSHGWNAIGILLFQDLAVIPALILIPTLTDVNLTTLSQDLLWALVKGAGAIIIILSIGKWILRPLFYGIAETRSLELFTLTALTVTLGAAWITNQLGLSMALGAFVAGMMLGETQFRHQIENDIRPFRDVLLGFFFISVGMQLDMHIFVDAWLWIIALLAAILLLKSFLIFSLGMLLGYGRITSTRTGLILAQGSEFGFAILTLALSYQVIPEQYGQVILAALLLSMLFASLLIHYNRRIASFVFPQAKKVSSSNLLSQVKQMSQQLHNHVIICGYGRVGQNIARFLEKVNLPYIALDLDPIRVENAQLAGENVCFADASHYELLKCAGIDHASNIVISFHGHHHVIKILEEVRRHHKNLPIIMRSYSEKDTDFYYNKGATEVIPEALEASLLLASHLLLMMKVPAKDVQQLVEESRNNRYDLLRMVYPGQEILSLEEVETARQGLQPVLLKEGAYAIGHTLSQLPLLARQVRVSAIRRGHQRFVDPKEDMTLQAGDIVVLYGGLVDLEYAESLLLDGEGR